MKRDGGDIQVGREIQREGGRTRKEKEGGNNINQARKQGKEIGNTEEKHTGKKRRQKKHEIGW